MTRDVKTTSQAKPNGEKVLSHGFSYLHTDISTNAQHDLELAVTATMAVCWWLDECGISCQIPMHIRTEGKQHIV